MQLTGIWRAAVVVKTHPWVERRSHTGGLLGQNPQVFLRGIRLTRAHKRFTQPSVTKEPSATTLLHTFLPRPGWPGWNRRGRSKSEVPDSLCLKGPLKRPCLVHEAMDCIVRHSVTAHPQPSSTSHICYTPTCIDELLSSRHSNRSSQCGAPLTGRTSRGVLQRRECANHRRTNHPHPSHPHPSSWPWKCGTPEGGRDRVCVVEHGSKSSLP